MKKIIASLSLIAASVTMVGCETAAQLGSMSQAGMAGLSCDQVHGAFNAYKADKSSANSWMELIKTVSPELDAKALIGDRSPEALYEDATLYTNLALTLRGCKPL